jgi:cellulose synthase (UDP-forming)
MSADTDNSSPPIQRPLGLLSGALARVYLWGARPLRSLGARLGVDDAFSVRQWLWRAFVRVEPTAPTWLEHALVGVLDRTAQALGLERNAQGTPLAYRLFGSDSDMGPQPGRVRRAWRRAIGLARRLFDRIPPLPYDRAGGHLDDWARSSWMQDRRVLFGGLAASAFGFWVTVTTPMEWQSQLLFDVVIAGAAIAVRNTAGTIPTLLLMTMSLIASCRYGWWRITQSLDLAPGWETMLGFGLLGAECYAWLIMLLGFVQCAWPLKRAPTPLPPDPALWPDVDVYIPTYNEPLSVVGPTVLAAKNLDWPADRLHIYLLDDGRRETMREFAEQAGVGYLDRPDNSHAKAGNLNHALLKTGADFVAIFDCDHLPVRSFLQLTMGAMVEDPRCAMVQTPHHFFSADPFERNLRTFRRVPNEGSLFYGLVQDGNDFWNATFFCGSCAVLRRGALMEIGGVAVETVTEDAHTALKLHRLGYRTAYINVTQAAGLATESLSQHVSQRIRWARGMAQIFRLDNPLLGRGLSLMQRLCYSNSMLHFFYGIPRLIFLTAPLAYLFFEMHIIRSPALIFALYLLPHLMLPHITTARMQGAYRHSFWAEVYETVLAWYITLPTLVAFVDPARGKFNVTVKGGRNERTQIDWHISRPYLALVGLNAAGFLVGLIRLFSWNRFEAGTVFMNLIWTSFNLLILGAAIGVAYERRQLRSFHRIAARLPVTLLFADGHTQHCVTSNYSLNGLGLRLSDPLDLASAGPLRVMLSAGDSQEVFDVRITAQRGISVGVQFTDTSHAAQQRLIACTFGRADAWTDWHKQYDSDLPLRGLREILTHGLQGYADLLASLLGDLRRRVSSSRPVVDPDLVDL